MAWPKAPKPLHPFPLPANAAVMPAEALARKPGHVGAIAFSRTGDPATGEFGDATVIRKSRAERPERAVKRTHSSDWSPRPTIAHAMLR